MKRSKVVPLFVDPSQAAAMAGLRYISDTQPGIKRVRSGKGFSYRMPDGTTVRDRKVLERIKALVIPPAWTYVWIATDSRGHIQACGRDKRKYKQYRYHDQWMQVRNQHKFVRMLAFGQVLPKIRERSRHDLSGPGMSRDKVLAVVIQLLQTTLIRVGNEEYARANDSYGLTTIREDQVDIHGQTVRFSFKGKSGVYHDISLKHARLARIIRKCQDIPGEELFAYLDADGNRHTIDSGEVNAYLQDITGQNFTAKDFRTWGGTLRALRVLQACPPPPTAAEAKSTIVTAIKQVAKALGNTPATCRKYYIHPMILEMYTSGQLPKSGCEPLEMNPDTETLTGGERCLIRLLQSPVSHQKAA